MAEDMSERSAGFVSLVSLLNEKKKTCHIVFDDPEPEDDPTAHTFEAAQKKQFAEDAAETWLLTVRVAAERARLSIPVEDGDYQVDGLWHCGRCGSPKQARIVVGGQTLCPMALCDCALRKKQDEAAAEEAKRLAERIARNRSEAFPDGLMSTWRFENDDMTNGPLTEAMKRYVAHFPTLREEGRGLLLFGKVGTGKTFAACEVVNALLDQGYSAVVTTLGAAVRAMQTGAKSGEEIERLCRPDLLVLDDLGVERQTDYVRERVFDLIDARVRSGRPMILTTNLSKTEFTSQSCTATYRIYSRILGACHPIEVEGRDRRREATREGYGTMKELLGM